jgi:hypothetical protein
MRRTIDSGAELAVAPKLAAGVESSSLCNSQCTWSSGCERTGNTSSSINRMTVCGTFNDNDVRANMCSGRRKGCEHKYSWGSAESGAGLRQAASELATMAHECCEPVATVWKEKPPATAVGVATI